MTVHIGLIGAGNISDTHARAVAEIDGAAVTAVFAPRRERAAALAARHGAAPYDDLDRFLAHRPMDIVAIGTPSGLHAEHGIAAARRGLHVLVEKPIDVSAARADALIAEAAKAGATLGVIFQDRLKPAIRRLKTLVDAGRLGSPILASARLKWYRTPEYYAESSWRGTRTLDGGGALMNQGVHTVDLLVWLFGPVRRVFGRTATRLHAIEVEDTATAALEFASGALGTIEASTAAYPGYSRRLELTGSLGTAVLDGDRLVALDLRDGSGAAAVDHEAAVANVAATSPVVADTSAHRAVFEDFIKAIAARATPSCDGPDGRRSVALIEAIYRSAASGECVTLQCLQGG